MLLMGTLLKCTLAKPHSECWGSGSGSGGLTGGMSSPTTTSFVTTVRHVICRNLTQALYNHEHRWGPRAEPIEKEERGREREGEIYQSLTVLCFVCVGLLCLMMEALSICTSLNCKLKAFKVDLFFQKGGKKLLCWCLFVCQRKIFDNLDKIFRNCYELVNKWHVLAEWSEHILLGSDFGKDQKG